MDRKDQNHLTFEAKLLNKYHQILNNYNSQKTEEECLKETKQKYNETINQSKKKMEQIKYKYDKKNIRFIVNDGLVAVILCPDK